MKTVSIIIPVYNCKKYVSKCLESVINQTYTQIEVILVDDGSTDGSELICNEYAEKYASIKVIHQNNAGAGVARNTGKSAASGEYITYVDADDYIAKECIEQMVQAMEDYDAEIVEVGNVYMLATRNVFRACNKDIEILEGNEQIIKKMSQLRNTVWGRLYRKDVIVGVDFSDKRIGEDSEYSLHILNRCNKLVRWNNCLYAYRAYQESITRTKCSCRKIKYEIKKLYNINAGDNEHIIEQIVNYCEREVEDIIYRGEQIISYKQLRLLENVMKDIESRNLYENKEKVLKIIEMINQAIKESKVSIIKVMYKKMRNYYNQCMAVVKTQINYEYKL